MEDENSGRQLEARLYLSPFLMDASTAMFNLALPLFGKELALNAQEIGWVKGAATLPYAFTTILAGKLSDRVGRRPVALAGTFAVAVVYSLLPLANGFWSLALLCASFSVSHSLFWPSVQGWVGDSGQSIHLPRALVTFNLAWSLGVASGLFAGGHLCEAGFHTVYAAASSVCVANALIVWSCRRPARRQGSPLGGLPARASRVLHVRYLRAHRLANFVSYFCIANVLTFFPLRALELNWSPSQIGHTVIAMPGVYALFFIFLGYTRAWHYRPFLMLAAQVFAATGLLALGRAQTPWGVWACLAAVGSMLGVSYYSSLYYSVTSEASLGEKAGWHESILRLGEFFGAVLGGATATRLQDLQAPFLLCACVTALGAVIFVIMVVGRDTPKHALPS